MSETLKDGIWKTMAFTIVTMYVTTLIALIYGIICSHKNYDFNKKDFNKDNYKIISEKLLYQQFSYEIITNHALKLILDFKLLPECPVNYNNIEIKTKESLNYNFALNSKKINNVTTNRGTLKFCVLFYSGFTYESLLKNSTKTYCQNGFKPCGILDTLENILCIPQKDKCPLNDLIIDSPKNSLLLKKEYQEININIERSFYLYYGESTSNKLIVDLLFSFITPFSHDWDQLLNQSIEDPYIIDYDFLHYKIDNFFQKKGINLSLGSSNKEQLFSLYNKNYIGIKDYEIFKEDFNLTDYKSNPLYLLSVSELYPSYLMEIFCIIFALIEISPCIFLYSIKRKEFFAFMILIVPTISIIFGTLFIVDYFRIKATFSKIGDNFDYLMQEIINLYNKRILSNSFKITVILFSLNFVFLILDIILFLLLLFFVDNGTEISYHRLD